MTDKRTCSVFLLSYLQNVTDYPLPLRGQVEGKGYSYSVVEQIDGDCSVVGGTSTAFIQRLQEG